MAIIEISGIPHFYELTSPDASSDLPVLVFIHGWLLSRNYWQPVVERLSSQYRCLTYDLRGFGDSQAKQPYQPQSLGEIGEMPSKVNTATLISQTAHEFDSSYTLAAYAQDLKILLQKLEIDRAWSIGHSLGGSIALWTAQFCPDRVKGVICLNSGGGIYLKEEFERFRLAGQQLVKYRPGWLSHLPFLDLLFARTMVASPLATEWGRQRIIDFVKADAKAALGSLLDTTTEAEVHLLPQLVSKLPVPVYFVAGECDRVMEPKYVRHLASFHRLFDERGKNVLEIANCGHLSMVECPDQVVAIVEEIINKHKLSE
jgi:pimeloyl-ACP methyl ester carboxylesterase